LIAAVTATCIDAVLLQLRRRYFTGGFLAPNSATAFSDRIAFLVSSVGADLACALAIGLLVCLIVRRAGFSHRRVEALVLAATLVPLVVYDVLAYEVLGFLNDLVDFGLLFRLSGADPLELLAVSAGRLGGWVVLAMLGALALALVVVVLRRGTPPEGDAAIQPPPDTILSRGEVLVALLLIGAGVAVSMRARLSDDVLDNGLRRKASVQIVSSVIEALTDVDRDGYGIIGPPADAALFESAIHPYAPNIPGNGIDENGVGGDLPAGGPYEERGPAPPVFAWQPTVVLIVLESFRADAVGAMVAGRAVTPALSALAAGALALPSAFSHNGYTVQSRFHIMSGSLAHRRGGTTLVDDFKANGYEVGYFSAQDESFGLNRDPRYAVGFDRADVSYDARQDVARRYSRFSTPGSLAVPAHVVLERVQAFLDRRNPTRPLFLYVNFHDTHFPYHHAWIDPIVNTRPLSEGAIAVERRQDLLATYLNTAANVDRAVGELIDRIRVHTGSEPAIVVIGDHGESLFESGNLGHGYVLDDAQTAIPLVVSRLPLELPDPFGQVDLRDRLLDALAAAPVADPRPRVAEAAGEVLQYLGFLDHPSQIALVGREGRTTYDFHRSRVKLRGQEEWRTPASLLDSERAEFLALIHRWERVRLAMDEGENR
jgi:hypothetical protein